LVLGLNQDAQANRPTAVIKKLKQFGAGPIIPQFTELEMADWQTTSKTKRVANDRLLLNGSTHRGLVWQTGNV